MNKLRTLLAAAGLGFFIDTAMAQENTASEEPTRAEVRKQLFSVAERVDYDSFGQKILKYPGAAFVLYDSSCNQTKQGEDLDRNGELVYLDSIKALKTAKVDNFPIKFTVYDICGKSKADLLGATGTKTEIHMYLQGERIDILGGAPTSLSSINEWSTFLIDEWIPTNLTAPNGKYAWRFEGTIHERKVPLLP